MLRCPNEERRGQDRKTQRRQPNNEKQHTIYMCVSIDQDKKTHGVIDQVGTALFHRVRVQQFEATAHRTHRGRRVHNLQEPTPHPLQKQCGTNMQHTALPKHASQGENNAHTDTCIPQHASEGEKKAHAKTRLPTYTTSLLHYHINTKGKITKQKQILSYYCMIPPA